MIFTITINGFIIIIFIIYIYFYMYLLKSLEFIVVYVCIEVESIYSNFVSTVFIEHVFIYFFHIFIHISWILFSFIQYMYYKIY